MPDNQKKLQQRFDQLPEGEPAFAMDTRIKAQARAQLQDQRSIARSRKRWNTGLATVACAGLALVIVKPLLDSSTPQGALPNTGVSLESYVADEGVMMEAAPAASAPIMQKSGVERGMSAGGGASPAHLEALPPQQIAPQLTKRVLVAPEAAMEMSEEAELAAPSLAEQSKPALQNLLTNLNRYRENAEHSKAETVREQIRKHYPGYSLD